MKYIKVYESYFTPEDIIRGAFIWGSIYGLIKYGLKYLKIKDDKKSLLNMIGTGHAESYLGWEIKEDGDIINISPRPLGNGVMSSITKSFNIYKSEMRVEYVSKSYPLDVKIPKAEFQNILKGIEFVKQISEEFNDYSHIISDEDFEIKVINFDFYERSFVIDIYKDRNLNPFNLIEISDNINHIIDMLKSTFNLELASPKDKRYIDSLNSPRRGRNYLYPIFLLKDGVYKSTFLSETDLRGSLSSLEKIDSLDLKSSRKEIEVMGHNWKPIDLNCENIYIKFIQTN